MSTTFTESRDAAGPVKVDIWSDVQCGWCYIAKRRLETAIEAFHGEVQIEYHSFELAPDAPIEFDGATKEFLYQYRGAPIAQTEKMLAQVTSIAAQEGLSFRFDRTRPTNTILAHELIHFAKSKGRQLEMNERLSEGYFHRGEHIGRIPELVEIAVELGFDRTEVTSALSEHRFRADVQNDFDQADTLGIRGIPFFVFNGKYGVSGAQEEDVFTKALEQAAGARHSAPAGATDKR
jgi:predicted DsbA family dithiol-disulfide isomerase